MSIHIRRPSLTNARFRTALECREIFSRARMGSGHRFSISMLFSRVLVFTLSEQNTSNSIGDALDFWLYVSSCLTISRLQDWTSLSCINYFYRVSYPIRIPHDRPRLLRSRNLHFTPARHIGLSIEIKRLFFISVALSS